MSLIEVVRQGAVVAAEFAALLTAAPAHATRSEIAASLNNPPPARILTVSHALAGPLMLDGLRPLGLLRTANAIDAAEDDDLEAPCGSDDDAADVDDDQPEANVVMGIDEAIADRSLTALVVERARAVARNP